MNNTDLIIVGFLLTFIVAISGGFALMRTLFKAYRKHKRDVMLERSVIDDISIEEVQDMITKDLSKDNPMRVIMCKLLKHSYDREISLGHSHKDSMETALKEVYEFLLENQTKK